jgi:hypothetical protein
MATVTVSSASGTPTGDVSLLAPTSVNGGIGDSTLSGGTVTISNVILPGSGGTPYNLNARYAGDTTFASSTSTPGVPVTVSKENSRLQYGIVTFDPVTGAITNTNSTSFAYGSPYILRMDVLNSTSNTCQPLVTGGVTTGCAFDATGTVTFTDSASGTPPGTGAGTFTINSVGHAENQPIQLTGGTHALSATYSGDISYNPAGPIADTLTVTMAATATQVVPSVTSITSGGSITLTATVATISNGAGPTGTVQFKNGSSALFAAATCTPTAATSTAAAFCTATLTTTLSFLPPTSFPRRIPRIPSKPIWILACLLLVMFLLSLKRLPVAKRYGYASAGLLLFVFLATAIAGCGGSSSSGHTDSITAVYSGDTNYAASTSAAVSISVH